VNVKRLLGVATVIAGLLMALGAGSAAAASTPQSQFVSIACTSAKSCFATGYSIDAAGAVSTLIERWDGTAWAIEPTSQPGSLNGVACAGPKSCFAVGASPTSSIVERWDGKAWTAVTTPTPPSSGVGFLNGIACTGPDSCFAVGDAKGASLVERWDGAAWTVVPSPNLTGAAATYLFGVSCSSPKNCNAVGLAPATGTVAAGSPVAEHWDGSAWTLVATPSPSGTSPNQLRGIACPKSTSCVAVGVGGTSPDDHKIVEELSGGAWSLADTSVLAASQLGGVACPSASGCVAVGAASGNTLIERRSPKGWAVQVSPNPPGTTKNAFYAVACPSATICLAVGQSGANTLAERWNGKAWAIVPSVNVPTS